MQPPEDSSSEPHPPPTPSYPTPASTPSEDSNSSSDASDNSIESESSGGTVQQQLRPPTLSHSTAPASISLLPTMTSESRGSMPSGSLLASFPKLGTCDVHHWKNNVEGYIKAIGLGSFIRASVPAPTDPTELDKFEMRQQQTMLAIRATLDPAHLQHIAGMDDPFLAIQALETRHGINSGLAAVNIITKIVNNRYDSSTKLEDYVSSTQALHNQLAKVASEKSGLKLSDQVLALLMLINLPRDEFGGMVQQLLGDISSLSTSNVVNRLLTEAQMNQSEPSQSAAYSIVARSRKPEKRVAGAKGNDRTSNAPDALCSHPGHQFSMHLNRDCKAKNNATASTSRPMQRQWSAPVSNGSARPSQSSVKPFQLSDADKIRLFDQALSARSTMPSQSVSANAVLADEGTQDSSIEEVINLTTAYSAIASDSDSKVDFFMDTGANKDIFNNINIFKNLHKIRPVMIKSANGGQMLATEAGDVTIITFDKDDNKCQITLVDALYCPEVAVNLISATKLCDMGFIMHGDAQTMSFVHNDGSKVFACRNAKSMDLWKARHFVDFASQAII